MNGTLPHADEVNGDLMTAAESLLVLGWQAPAVLTARVALERCLLELVATTGLPSENALRGGSGGLCHLLKINGLIGEKLHWGTVRLNRELSAVAHGEPVTLFDAVRLVELTQDRLADFRQLK